MRTIFSLFLLRHWLNHIFLFEMECSTFDPLGSSWFQWYPNSELQRGWISRSFGIVWLGISTHLTSRLQNNKTLSLIWTTLMDISWSKPKILVVIQAGLKKLFRNATMYQIVQPLNWNPQLGSTANESAVCTLLVHVTAIYYTYRSP